MRLRTPLERSGWPSPELLDAARRVSLVFALGALLSIYLVGRQLGGGIVGALALVIATVNPLLATVWTAAIQEGPLAFFSLISLWLVLRSVSQPIGGRLGTRHSITVGVAIALSMATKLTAALGAAGIRALRLG